MNSLFKKIKLLLLLSLGLSFIGHTQIIKTLADLPKDIKWQTNLSDPSFASPNAIKGGMFRMMIADFPPTFRTVGPNSNSPFRGFLDANKLGLVGIHPQTGNYIPELASHWWVDPNHKTAYFQLNPKAKWSDGVPVTADDFLYTITFMRSPDIVAPWYNNYYSNEIDNVTRYDDHTISITLKHAKPFEDVLINVNLAPTPKHFQKLRKDWVQWANWKIPPTTGPYVITNFRKGRYIDFTHVKNWWGNDQRYFKNRFNVDTVRIKVVRNLNIAWNMFLKGDLDSFAMVLPEYWHQRSKAAPFKKGWIDKYWFYNEVPQSAIGIYLNLDDPLFADKRVRYAIAYALNITKMNKTLLYGDYEQLPGFNTGLQDYANPDIHARTFDLKKANQLLDKAGWTKRDQAGIRVKDGQKLEFKLTYTSNVHTSRLALLKEEMLKAGINMKLQLLAGASGYRNIMEKKHQATWLGWSVGLRPAYRQHFHSENAHKPQTNNVTNTDDPEMDRLIDAYRTATDKKSRIKYAFAVQQKIYEIGAFIPAYMVPYTREAAWAYVKIPKDIAPKTANQIFDPMGLGTLWLDPKTKQDIHDKKRLPVKTIIDKRYQIGG